MAEHIRYLASKQGNRNLALDDEEGCMEDDFAAACAYAESSAKRYLKPWYVHEVSVRTVREYRAAVEMKVRDMS